MSTSFGPPKPIAQIKRYKPLRRRKRGFPFVSLLLIALAAMMLPERAATPGALGPQDTPQATGAERQIREPRNAATLAKDRLTGRHLKPIDVLDRFRRAMRDGNSEPDLLLYTPASRVLMALRPLDRTDMAIKSLLLANCPIEMTFYDSEIGQAVIRSPLTARDCPPWFFARGHDRWMLDVVAMRRHLRIDDLGLWQFAACTPPDCPYGFAFRDWRFTEAGAPRLQSSDALMTLASRQGA